MPAELSQSRGVGVKREFDGAGAVDNLDDTFLSHHPMPLAVSFLE